MTTPRYLGGKRPYSNADRLQAQYDKIHGKPTPWQERPAVLAAFLAALMLGAGLMAAWGWPVFVYWLIGDVGVVL